MLEAEWFVIIALIAAGSASAKKLRLLTGSGAVAAFFAGLSVFLGFGVPGLMLLGLFFLTSNLWSKYKQQRKRMLGDLHEKGSTRDWAQVFANGGTAAIAGIIHYLHPDPVWLVAFSISLASANADTWASELGVLSKKPPFSFKTFQPVPRGTSGAISIFGTLAAAAGSLLIASASMLLFDLSAIGSATVFLLGFMGSMIDTLLGATVQAVYQCPDCRGLTEKKHHCRSVTVHFSGYRLMNNDAVNFLAGFISVLMGISLYWIML